jgi:hypothetical protein
MSTLAPHRFCLGPLELETPLLARIPDFWCTDTPVAISFLNHPQVRQRKQGLALGRVLRKSAALNLHKAKPSFNFDYRRWGVRRCQSFLFLSLSAILWRMPVDHDSSNCSHFFPKNLYILPELEIGMSLVLVPRLPALSQAYVYHHRRMVAGAFVGTWRAVDAATAH